MVKYREDTLDDVFIALASSFRRDVLSLLANKPKTMSELASPLGLSLPALHKHLKILQRAKLVEGKKIGRERELTFQPQVLKGAQEWIAFHREFWNEQFDAIEKYIEETKGEKTSGSD